jgi:hypothetical protein
MLWFESLLFYGCEEREQEKDDVDVALLPTIVEKVILPKLTGIDYGIEHSHALGFSYLLLGVFNQSIYSHRNYIINNEVTVRPRDG